MTPAGAAKSIGILGMGMHLPSRVMTNDDLAKIVDTSDEWIRTRTGIRERRIAAPGTCSSDLGAAAATAALADAGLRPEQVQAIIVTTTSPDMICPSTACMVQAKIGAVNAACFDVMAACSGFVYALTTAHGLVAAQTFDHVLVIGTEVLSALVDWTDRSTCVLFGDAAGAAVVGPSKRGRILASYLGSDGTCHDVLEVPAGGSRMPASRDTVEQRLHFLKMKGSEVFKCAVRKMEDATARALKKCGRTYADVDVLIPHQANTRIIQAMSERTGLDPAKVFVNVDRYGNTSAASVIVALCEAVQQGRVKPGDCVALVAFGSGFTWGSVVLEW